VHRFLIRTTIIALCLLVEPLAAAEGASQKAVLVTGASSGIGLRITETLSANGFHVYAGARKAEDLKRLDAMENVSSVRLDVTVQEDIDAAAEFVRTQGRGLWGVVNNAGVALYSPLSTGPESELKLTFDINVYGPFRVNQAFLPDILSFHAGANYRYRSPDGFALRLRFCPLIWIGTGDRSSIDPELFVLYAAQAGYEGEMVAVGGGLSGRYLLTAEGESTLGSRTMHQFGLYANFDLGGWGPGIQARLPLDDDLQDVTDPVFSLSVSWKLSAPNRCTWNRNNGAVCQSNDRCFSDSSHSATAASCSPPESDVRSATDSGTATSRCTSCNGWL